MTPTLVARNQFLDGSSHNRVRKYFNGAGTTFGAASHLGSRLFPPAPLTGDVGRGCGDASRALLFLWRSGAHPAAFLEILIGRNFRSPGRRGRQEMIRSERTNEKSRSCVTIAAALIANALAA